MAGSLRGRCLCGGVRFEIEGPVEPPVACHCRECQRQSGSFWVAVSAERKAVSISGSRLGWVSVSQKALRGFCRDCGGYLFWQPVGGDTLDVAFGALEDTGGLSLRAHIFCEEARLPVPEDGLPRYPRARKDID